MEFLTSQSWVLLDAAEAMVDLYFKLVEEDNKSDTVYVTTKVFLIQN